jgi:hypothetical protein
MGPNPGPCLLAFADFLLKVVVSPCGQEWSEDLHQTLRRESCCPFVEDVFVLVLIRTIVGWADMALALCLVSSRTCTVAQVVILVVPLVWGADACRRPNRLALF